MDRRSEARCGMMHQMYDAEPSEEVKRQLKPLLDEVDDDMGWMIRSLAQENP